jgi:hypothetical protein
VSQSETITLLFTDVVSSTEHLRNAGDETTALERGAAWGYYVMTACAAATTLWLLNCTHHVEVIERWVVVKFKLDHYRKSWPARRRFITCIPIKSGFVIVSAKFVLVKVGEMIVTRSLSPASWRKLAEIARTANLVA